MIQRFRNINMIYNKTKNTIGIILIILLALSNLSHLPWTYILTLEQISIGYGTMLELAVLFPWLLETLLIPVIISGILFFAVFPRKTASKGVTIAVAVLLGSIILQIVITNFFINF